jgi:type II secretory pathway pseudopilin PulG
MTLLIANWKLCLIAILIAACGLLYGLWQSSEAKLAKVKAAGEYAKQEKDRIETLYNTTLKETTDAWSKAVPTVRANAVTEYIKRFGRMCDAGKVPVPGAAKSPEVHDGAEPQRVGNQSDEFISSCAEDALYRVQVRAWVVGNKLAVE